MRSNLSRILTLVCSTALLGCGGGSKSATAPVVPGNSTPGTTTPPDTTQRNTGNNAPLVVNYAYSPSLISVAAGTTVTWTWSNTCTGDGGYYGNSMCVQHTVTFDGGGPTSDVQSVGSFSRTFATPGTYTYHCLVHGPSMSGIVEVK